MAPRSIVAPVRRPSSYICNACISATTPTYSLAAASWLRRERREATTNRSQHTLTRARWPQTLVGPIPCLAGSQKHARTYSSESSSSTTTVQAGIALLPHRRLISVAGPDAAKFLQGLVTNNVDSTRLSPFYAAFLDARGRVLWDVFIWVWPELVADKGHWACYIEVDAGEAESLKKHLKKHKLRSKVEIRDVATDGEEGIRVWAAWGGAHQLVRQASEIAGLRDPRGQGLYRYLANAHLDDISQGSSQVDTQDYHVQRYIQGIPEGPAEIPREHALPMEYNIDLSGGIDFRKGCYVGQELTIRTKHTGVVRKRVLPVQLHQADLTRFSGESYGLPKMEPFVPMLQSGADIKGLDEARQLKKGRATGRFIVGIGNVGLALCRLENMTHMRVTAEGGTYKESAEFGAEVDGATLRIVPVLHPWFLQRKEALWDHKKGQNIRTTDTVDI